MLSRLRFVTTLNWHQKTTKFKWYKKWHDFRFSHHLHVATVFVVLGLMIFSTILNLFPAAYNTVLAANGSWSQTSDTDFNGGTYSSTELTGTGDTSVRLKGVTGLSNNGSGAWGYKRPIAVTNSTGGTLSDYQVQVNPFSDATFFDNNGLKGSWHFSEGAGTFSEDKSGNNNNGTMSGSSYWSSSGKAGNGFQGAAATTNYMQAADSSSLRFTTALTFEAWVKPSNITGNKVIISKRNHASDESFYSYQLMLVNGQVNLSVHNSTSNPTVYPTWRSTNTVISSGEWNHVVAAWNRTGNSTTDMKFYVNGSEAATTFYTGGGTYDSNFSISSDTNPVYIGKSGRAAFPYYFEGVIDEVKAFNRQIGPAEALARYNHFQKVKADYSDLRFTDSTGGTEYSYWQETDSKFWVKVPSLANGANTINMYYGNSSATSSSSGDNALIFYEDFESGNLSKWTTTPSPWTNISTPVYTGTRAAGASGINTGALKKEIAGLPTYLYQEFNVRFGENNLHHHPIRNNAGAGSGDLLLSALDSGFWAYYSGSAYVNLTGNPTYAANTWYKVAIISDYANDRYKIFINGVDYGWITNNTRFNSQNGLITVEFANANTSATGTMYIDNVAVRKSVGTEPTHTAPGAEAVVYSASGSFTSSAITATGLYGDWGILAWNATLNGQTFSVDVLNGGTGATIQSNVASGANLALSTATYPSLKLKANLSGNGSATPLLDDWSLAYNYDVTAPAGTTLNWGTVSNTTIAVSGSGATDTESSANPNEGTIRYYIERDDNATSFVSADANSGWIMGEWAQSSLSPNTAYSYRIKSKDAVGNESDWATPTPAYKYTLTNLPSSPTATAASSSQINLSWIAPTGGADHYHVYSSSDNYSVLIYNDSTASTSQTGLTANTTYTYRIYGVNADNVTSTSYASVSADTLPEAPNSPTASAVSTNQINISWAAPGAGASHYRVYSSSDNYITPIHNDTGTSASEASLSANTQYTYRIYSVNTDDAESETYATVSAYTWAQAPVLNAPASPTNNNKPPISNSNTPDSSFALNQINLYDNGGLIATTTANGSGVFTFGPEDYAEALSDGNHNNLTTKALNEENVESEASNVITIFIDTVVPTAPNTRTAAKVADANGSDINDADWNGNNNAGTVYFAWSGAADGEPSSLIKRYWVYFGPNSGAVPRTEGQATANSTLNVARTLSSPVSGTDYYLRIQTEDNAGNISSDGSIPTLFVYKYDATAPASPTTITPSPAAWSTANSFNFEWSNWTEAHSGLDYYLYVRKTSASTDAYESLDPINRKLTDVANPINLNNIEALYNGVNWIRVYAVDKAGNTSSSYGSAPFFYSGTVSAPTITPSPVYNTTNSFSFTITKPSDVSVAGYYCGVNTPLSPSNSTYIDISALPQTVTINGKNTNATVSGDVVTLSAFSAAAQTGENHLYCATENEAGNIGWSTSGSGAFTVNTTAPDAPADLRITDASDRGTENWALTVGWTALQNQPVDFNGYEVWRCTTGCDNNSNYSKVADVSTNIYSEASLSNFVEYFYKVKAKDNVGVASGFSDAVSKIPTGKFTTPPSYTSAPRVEANATNATITWTTNRATNTIVQYGLTGSYGQENSKSTEAVTEHTITIYGLTPGTTYNYCVQSLDLARDYDSSVAFSQNYTFKTSAAPGISQVSVSEIRLTTAIITWKTTSSATSTIHYGTTTSYGKTYVDSSASQTTTHTVKLTGLADSTTYNFKVVGEDIEGNSLSSDNYVFTTLTFPKISNLKVEQVPNTPTSTVKVSFETNVPATTQVTVTGNGGKEAATYNFSKEHQLVISGLRDNTAYTVTARGRDEYGNETIPVSESYKTEYDTRPPYISNITVETSILGYGTEAKGQVVVSWTTDEPSTSQVEYGAGVAGGEYTSKSQEDSALTQNHVVIISDLKPSAPYHFRVVSSDTAGNTGKSADNSVLTEQANESVIDLVIKSLQNTIGWIFNVFARS